MQQGWSKPSRQKREPMTAFTLSLLLGTSLGGLGMGISALVTQNQYYSNLRVTRDVGIESTEKPISPPRGVLILPGGGSIAEQEGIRSSLHTAGGLCAALGEECYFFTDHSGIIKDNMVQVREGLAKWKREGGVSQGWFET